MQGPRPRDGQTQARHELGGAGAWLRGGTETLNFRYYNYTTKPSSRACVTSAFLRKWPPSSRSSTTAAPGASAAWRALVVRSRSSPRRWCCCSRWLSKGRPDWLVARDIEVEFVNFGRSLPQMLDATSTSKSTCRRKIEMSPGAQSRDDTPWVTGSE